MKILLLQIAGLGQRLNEQLGAFPLPHYWGPRASIRSSRWISAAVESVMLWEHPDFIFAYIPHLDYVLQRYGPDGRQARKGCREVDRLISALVKRARSERYEPVVFGDYPFEPATGVVYPNRFLAESGFLKTRTVKGMLYPNFHMSSAFCVADHQVAHLHVWDGKEREAGRNGLASLEGVETVLGDAGKQIVGLDHPRSGDFILVAKPGYWFDYRWWTDKRQAPDYAAHVDIHNKPGYDPCELFPGWPPLSVSQNPARVKGTHGRLDADEKVFYASSADVPGDPQTLTDLAAGIKKMLQ
jgi:predicted AlkP superfamily pyrophosphatase or phosphodiesterase